MLRQIAGERPILHNVGCSQAALELRSEKISLLNQNTLVRGPRQVMKLHRVYYHPNCEFSTGSCKIGIRVKFSKESSVSINYRFHYRDWFNKTEPLDTSSLYEFSMLNLPLKYFLYVATSTRASDGFLSRFRGRMSGRGYVNFSRELKTRHKAAIYGLKLADLHFDLSQDGIRKKKRIKLRPVELNATITKNWQFKLSHNRSRKLKIRSNFGSILVAGSVDFSNDETSLRVRRLKSFGYSPWNSRYTPYVRLKISRSGKKSGLLIALKEFNRCKAHVGGQIYVSGLLSMTRCFGK